MNSFLSISIIVCSVCGIATELHTILFPNRVLKLLNRNDPVDLSAGMIVLSILSLLYLVNILLLAFSGDAIFIAYAGILGALSLAMILFRQFMVRYKYLIMVESAICLIILLDVVRSVLRMSNLFH